MRKLFGTDGIRGTANRYPMDATMALAVGRAVTHLARSRSGPAQVVLGKDTRGSGNMLESALSAGITSMGGNACLAGVLPTPGVAFLTQRLDAQAGIVISASHNPYQDNGIKIFSGSGSKLSEKAEETIEQLILEGNLPEKLPPPEGIGTLVPIEDAGRRYVAFLIDTFPGDLSMRGLKIVLDTANGATYKVAPDAFTALGADVEVIHNRPDGVNINDNCGSQHTQNLQKRVLASSAAVGLAFDGDGDRLIAVDEKGHTLTGDQILVICAKMLKDLRRLRNDLLVSTVMSNIGLGVACKKYGFKHHASNVGDRYVLEDMQRLHAAIGGEQSGHMIFLDHHTTGDGIIAAMQLIAAMLRARKPLSELAKMMDIYPQTLINVEVKEKPEIFRVPQILAAIQQVETELGDQGRVLVRYSGTENLCRVMVEGPAEALTQAYCKQIAVEVERVLG
jgi:phosphoglucosamine mutase